MLAYAATNVEDPPLVCERTCWRARTRLCSPRNMELLPSHKHSSKACEKYNGMMDERFTIFRFNSPLPREQRLLDWPSCGCCAAKFYPGEGAFGTNVFQSPSALASSGPHQLRLRGLLALGQGRSSLRSPPNEKSLHVCIARVCWTPKSFGQPNAGSSRHGLAVFVGCARRK